MKYILYTLSLISKYKTSKFNKYKMDANGVPTMDGNSDPYMTSQSNAHSTYHTAEYLAQNDHGMTFQGGINGGWTHPTSGNPLTAATYMQVSADLRAQTNSYHGGADRGHATAQHAAQLAANGIRSVQATIASINYQPCNSGSYQQAYQQQQQQNELQQRLTNNLQSEYDSVKNQMQNSQNTWQKQELQNKLSGIRVRQLVLERSQNQR